MDAILDVLEHAPRAGAIADMFESSLKSLTLQAFVLLNQNQPVGMVVLGRNLMSLAGHMLPVRPRRAVPNLTGNKDLDDIFMDVSIPFAVWVLERPLSSFPKLYVNNSIVVVGSSHTGLAFLETLFLGPTCKYLTFSNVTLVSEHGLPTFAECLEAAHTCVPKDGRYTDRHLKTVPFYFYLDVVSAVMIGIDRKNKCILLKSGGVKYYDELVLTCGQQFQHPDYLRDPLELVKEVELGKPCDRMLIDNPRYQPDKVPLPPDMPENVMVINSLYQADICLRKLLGMITECIVVYGESIEAYSCMAALLEVGLSPEVITFVEPFPSEDHAKLSIDERVQGNLEQIGIRVYRNSHLLGWRQCNIHVEALHLMSPLQTICIPCFALFYYGLKAIDIYAFKVYDGGLVVGPDYDTNDPHVFGAGTCTKFSRRLYADPLTHRYYCSEDVGEALAKLFLKKLDPFVMSADPAGDSTELTPKLNSSLLAWQPVVKFDSPICQSATLPGPLYYMKLRKPGIEIPMEVQMCLPHRGHTLLTDKSGNYFRLQLNVLHCVAAVTCLSKKPFSSEVLSQLYGKHEALFNKLLTRYQMQLIPDLYDFFTQPWMAALYQETFEVLLRDVNSQDVGTVYDLVKSRFTLYDEGVKFKEMSQSYQEMSHACMCSTDPSGGHGPQLRLSLGIGMDFQAAIT
ncbi:Uncharacterized protein OBRU01_22732 [Operophtera brumata]|uniref:CFAP61 dimerisation domain-containing protein n=1 Tax=Operophtera brumata TaxID=104452 RepID=A0A0L7KQV9_OPEBR|nr:Uncharacterized protein OBRU01_22732 [Operophtera brumata]